MKTILVIEDTPEMRENIAEILELAPYHVVQATNGKQGIELARQIRPDLILCDIMMPELDGYGVLHILSKDPTLLATPFLFLTAKAEMADFRFGMNLGADDYLTKPFDDLTLLNAVELRLKKGERGQIEPIATSAGLEKLTRALLNAEDARQYLKERYQTTHYKKKHTLFSVGSSPIALYFISRGKIKVFNTDTAGNEFITELHGEGDFVGYLSLLEDVAYSETAEILDDAEVCTIPKADFLTLIYHHQDVANRFIQLLTGDVVEHQERLLSLAYQSVRKRVAEALLMFQRKFYPMQSAQPTDNLTANISPAMALSRENWSHLVGASTETVIRILRDFRTEGLIGINASQITLLDIKKLTQLKH
ncbi:response regulator [Spirosoma endbachense]|uniref:Response regulator n=1 Tax=Spirosoma endbachense TaxID=2666025 RepID=A0A6P1W1B1_9BACT|nr:response regulator [Spirosoma endbachense]QHV98684.1 response regulator [Spirosoma endbachense]